MAKNGLLIEYEYCTGCHTCEVACKQEHAYPVGKGGIKVNELITEGAERLRIDYIPFPTEFCDLCGARTNKGEQPACVKHCQAAIMWYGSIGEMSELMEQKPRSVLYAPRATFNIAASV